MKPNAKWNIGFAVFGGLFLLLLLNYALSGPPLKPYLTKDSDGMFCLKKTSTNARYIGPWLHSGFDEGPSEFKVLLSQNGKYLKGGAKNPDSKLNIITTHFPDGTTDTSINLESNYHGKPDFTAALAFDDEDPLPFVFKRALTNLVLTNSDDVEFLLSKINKHQRLIVGFNPIDGAAPFFVGYDLEMEIPESIDHNKAVRENY